MIWAGLFSFIALSHFFPPLLLPERSLSVYVTTRNGKHLCQLGVSRAVAASAFSAYRRVISSRRFAMEADKTISPSSDRVNREGLQGPREDNSSRPVGTEVTVNDGASVWDGCVLGGDLNKNTVGFCSILLERCVIHAAWFSNAGFLAETSIVAYSLFKIMHD
ncbi:hypothetical protein J1N35_019889 [Gossypium stocksii]|uniref:RNase H type-1 domain-containing protein n=1 Tax=Gossypium stocksii TaxID=47602 RepID=A0A9D3VBJ7_9ROSI|nr:hypothetical protein J1N35_019889 [Gossypium stocksii]